MFWCLLPFLIDVGSVRVPVDLDRRAILVQRACCIVLLHHFLTGSWFLLFCLLDCELPLRRIADCSFPLSCWSFCVVRLQQRLQKKRTHASEPRDTFCLYSFLENCRVSRSAAKSSPLVLILSGLLIAIKLEFGEAVRLPIKCFCDLFRSSRGR